MRRLILLVGWLFLVATLAAQIQPPQQSVTVSSTTLGACAAGACATWPLTVVNPSMTLQVSGTFSGTLQFEATADNATWFAIALSKLSTGASSTTTTGTGQYAIGNTGIVGIRVRATTLNSGGANITLTRGSATSAHAGGSGGGCAPAGTLGSLLYDDGASGCTGLADVAAGSYVRSGGVGAAPVYSTLTLPNAATTGDLLIATSANTIGRLADVATGKVLGSGGVSTAPAYIDPPAAGDSGAFQYNNAGVLGGDPSPTGLRRVNAGAISLSLSGGGLAQVLVQHDGFDAIRVQSQGNTSFARVAMADGAGGDLDVALARSAAGIFQINNGTDDTFTGTNLNSFALTAQHLQGRGTVPAVTNTSAASCGSTAATIVGTDTAGKVTVGGTGGTSCTVTFNIAWANAPSCFVTNETTANLSRATSTTTTVILAGTFVAADVLAYGCIGR